MIISLKERTAETVAIYFNKTQNDMIRKVLPQKSQTVEEALEDYKKALLPGSTSFGRTIWVDGRYIGDIWCYGMDHKQIPRAMLSYCLFETNCWNRGIATKAVQLFLEEIAELFGLNSIGAFTFTENIASCRVLEKNGFVMQEEFVENDIVSRYYQCDIENE